MKRKLTILLVEDDIFLMSMYGAKFREEGFTLIGAGNAAEALKEVKAVKPSPVLLDIMLPDEDGIAVLKKIKSDKTTASIPVVLLSNLSSPSHREEGLVNGAADYWVKMHFEPTEIVEKVKALLA